MATWIIRTQISDYKHALEMAEEQKNRGYKVWIEEKGGHARSLKKGQTNRSFGGVFFWLGPIALGLAGLYLIGVWVDRVL